MLPVVVLIPGAFAPLTVYSFFIWYLREAGFRVVVAILDSADPRDPKSAGPSQDADSIRERLVAPLVQQHGHEVILVAHSHGGMVAGGISHGLSQRQRARSGVPGGVLGFVYLAAFFPLKSIGVKDLLSSEGSLSLSLNDPRPGLARKVLNASAGLRSVQTHAMAAFGSPPPEPDWLSDEYDDRRVYVVAANDESLPPQFQRAFVEQSGVRWDAVEMQTPHDVFDCAPTEVVGVLQKCARQWTGSLQGLRASM